MLWETQVSFDKPFFNHNEWASREGSSYGAQKNIVLTEVILYACVTYLSLSLKELSGNIPVQCMLCCARTAKLQADQYLT